MCYNKIVQCDSPPLRLVPGIFPMPPLKLFHLALRKASLMLQESTKTLLLAILHSLETAGESGWDDQIELGKECLYEMHQMTRPSFKAYRMNTYDAKWPAHIPNSDKLNRAMPHVKLMVSAIRRKDHATAIENGKAALAAM